MSTEKEMGESFSGFVARRLDESTRAHMAGATVVDGVTFETPMAPQTHQQVVDAMEAVDAAGAAARRAADDLCRVKYRELQAQCGAIGHVFGASLLGYSTTRMCVFCRAHEPAKEAQP